VDELLCSHAGPVFLGLVPGMTSRSFEWAKGGHNCAWGSLDTRPIVVIFHTLTEGIFGSRDWIVVMAMPSDHATAEPALW